MPSAVVVELTHLATLYHDDVMDEAEVRRGVASANARWGNSVAVLTGDFLFARASHVLADLGPEAVRVQAEAFERLVTGQILETAGPRTAATPSSTTSTSSAGKTGSLVAVSCRFGAMMSGADESVVDVLTQYGERLGVAFQLADDVLDIASDSPRVRQDPRHRSARGHPHAAGAAAARAGGRHGLRRRTWSCVELLDGDLTDDARHAEALAGCGPTPRWSRPGGTPCATRRRPGRCWRPLPECAAKSALVELCDAVVHRAGLRLGPLPGARRLVRPAGPAHGIHPRGGESAVVGRATCHTASSTRS